MLAARPPPIESGPISWRLTSYIYHRLPALVVLITQPLAYPLRPRTAVLLLLRRSCILNLLEMSQLSYARYGKDNVRLYKVDKDPKTGIHTVVEQTVRILLEGDIETS